MIRGAWPALLVLSVVCVVMGALPSQLAHAHRTSLARSVVTIAGRAVHFRLEVSSHDLAVALGIPTDLITPLAPSAFTGMEPFLGAYLESNLHIVASGEPCPMEAPDFDFSRLPESVLLPLEFVCPADVSDIEITYRLFLDIDPAHRSIGRLKYSGGSEEFLFDRSLDTFWSALRPTENPPGAWRNFGRLVLFGSEHILNGVDHLLFLLALIIVNIRMGNLLRVVTAFTIAHSLTLALAWFGAIQPPARAVESLIALSIVYVAAENLWGRSFSHRWMVAFGFGLVHGMGFYSALRGLEDSGGNILVTLLGFNLGVEAGQLAAVAAVFPIIAWSATKPWFPMGRGLVSGSIMLIAGFWFIQRVLCAEC